ncbi:MAG: leucine-rich repeat domain-containing protein [Lachnospiraceae bacterium]|nr:leucine-rich repeat domain-containing protein [Lachnospiraceae bacterium]
MGRKLRRLIAILLCITSVMILCMPSEPSYASTKVGNYEMDGSTLVRYTGSDEMITLPNTVQTIGKDAFSGNSTLLKVVIPDSVRNIDFAAFENCSNLMQVVIPESVRAIGSSAFSGCEQLQYVNIPKKCTQIGSAAFAKCGKLTGISVAPGNESYVCVDGVLYSIDGKKVIQYLAGRTRGSYNMPSTVESIEEYAFWGAPQLADISLSSKLKEIPEYAFANCSGLTNVVLPYNIESLMAYSFSDCYNLRNVSLPDSVGYIDEKAFYLTNNVMVNYYDSDEAKRKVAEAGVSEEDFADYIGTVSSNSYDVSVSGSAGEKTYLNQMPYVSSVTPDYSDNKIPGELASGKIVGGSAMVMLPRDVHVYGFDIDSAESEDSVPYESGMTGQGGDYRIVSGTLDKYNGTNTSPSLPSGIRRIGNRSFYKNTAIKEVTIPSGLDSIGDFAFARSGIEKISIPEGTTAIGYAAFYNCGALKEVSIPDSVSRIELGAFDGTPWLDMMLKGGDGNDFFVAGDGILLGYRGGGGNVSIPGGVKTIGSGCFRGNTSITGVTLPQGLITIGEDAFNGCSGLTSVSIPDTVTDIEDRAFKDCAFKQVIVPGGVKRIGLGAFDRSGLSADQADPEGAVVFLGNELPTVSYKNTATRLSAYDLRSLPFAGYNNVVIGSDTDISNDSILSPNEFGFRGQVYTISSDRDLDRGTLRLIQSDSDNTDADGNVFIDPHVVINDKKYIMTGVSAGAFEPYEKKQEWTDKVINRVSITGNTSPELNTMLESINSALVNVQDNNDNTDDGTVILDVDMDPSISPDKDEPFAAISGNDGNYNIKIEDALNAADRCRHALMERYGTSDVLMTPLNIEMYDNVSNIPVTRLSGRKVDIELPVPGALTTAPDISVGAINDNGVLEEISSEIVSHGGNDKIRFVAPHFSLYLFYVRPEQTRILSAENTENMGPNIQNAVIMTLNRSVGSVQIKWYLAVILISLAAILFLYKGKKAGS